jgi:hypothetical protein
VLPKNNYLKTWEWELAREFQLYISHHSQDCATYTPLPPSPIKEFKFVQSSKFWKLLGEGLSNTRTLILNFFLLRSERINMKIIGISFVANYYPSKFYNQNISQNIYNF